MVPTPFALLTILGLVALPGSLGFPPPVSFASIALNFGLCTLDLAVAVP